MERWREHLEAGIRRMIEGGQIDPGAGARALSFSVFSALQGGLMLMRTYGSAEPLSAALDGALGALRASGQPAAEAVHYHDQRRGRSLSPAPGPGVRARP